MMGDLYKNIYRNIHINSRFLLTWHRYETKKHKEEQRLLKQGAPLVLPAPLERLSHVGADCMLFAPPACRGQSLLCHVLLLTRLDKKEEETLSS